MLSALTATAGPITGANWVAIDGGPQGINGDVSTIAIDTNGNVYAGGKFYLGYYGGPNPLSQVAEWNGTSWSALGVPGANNNVYALAFDPSGNLYAVGTFPFLAKWNGNTWSEFSGPDIGYALLFDKAGNLYEGCDSFGAQPSNGIVKWNGSTWSAVGGGFEFGAVFALTVDSSSNLYAGGEFSTIGGVPANNIAKWNGTNWSTLGDGISGHVDALAFDAASNLYVSGYFTNAGSVSANYIAEWNGSSWTNLGCGMNDEVTCLAFDNTGNLYAGGTFTNAGGVSALYIAEWNGTSWSAIGSGIPWDDDTLVIALDNSLAAKAIGSTDLENLYVGGVADIVGGFADSLDKILIDGPTPDQLSFANMGASTNVLLFLGTPGSNYVLDLATNLSPPIQWMPQSTNAAFTNSAATAGYVRFTNMNSFPAAFYRTQLSQ
ncbi:MAG TPA: hypothetical protein VH619_09235 [Verrucomicrobiae bacterium]|nr:hypothetical protein [Verrucomicrobiae bacterium]